jgi:hypothetical protein
MICLNFSESNENELEIREKYENAKQLSLKCVSYESKQRPDCNDIISGKHLWEIQLSTGKFKKEFNEIKTLGKGSFGIVISVISYKNFSLTY